MPKSLPPREQLKCPLCRRDIGGHLAYDQVREWLKRQERRLTLARMRLRKADRKRAAVMLRRLVVEEAGEINVSDGGKTLGLRPLSEILVDLVWDELFAPDRLPENGLMDYATLEQDEFKLELARMVEKKIVEYFTGPPRRLNRPAKVHPPRNEGPRE